MLSSHCFLCLPFRLPHWTVPCRIVLASPDDRVTCPYHFSLRLFTEVRRSSYRPIVCHILAFTSSLVLWSLYETPRSLRKHLFSNACILLSMSAVFHFINFSCEGSFSLVNLQNIFPLIASGVNTDASMWLLPLDLFCTYSQTYDCMVNFSQSKPVFSYNPMHGLQESRHKTS